MLEAVGASLVKVRLVEAWLAVVVARLQTVMQLAPATKIRAHFNVEYNQIGNISNDLSLETKKSDLSKQTVSILFYFHVKFGYLGTSSSDSYFRSEKSRSQRWYSRLRQPLRSSSQWRSFSETLTSCFGGSSIVGLLITSRKQTVQSY